jgi:hypothetical protein
MKLTGTIDHQHQLAVLTFTDSAGADDWVRAISPLRGEAGFPSRFQVLIDCRHVSALDTAFIERFGGWIRDCCEQKTGARWALVAEDGLGYGAARELAMRVDAHGIPMEAFNSPQDSLRWLRGEAAAESGVT